MVSRINRLERESVKFILAGRYRGIAIRSQRMPAGEGWQRARGENWVTTVDAVVNKEMAGEQRCRLCFIRSFKGVMWHYVGNWLSLKEPTMEGGGRKEGDGRRRTEESAPVSAQNSQHAGRHIFWIYTRLYKHIPGSSKAFYIPTGKTSHQAPPHPHPHLPPCQSSWSVLLLLTWQQLQMLGHVSVPQGDFKILTIRTISDAPWWAPLDLWPTEAAVAPGWVPSVHIC